MALFGNKGITRRRFFGASAATAAGAAALAATGCSNNSGKEKKTSGEPQVVKDDSKIVDALDEFKDADTGLAAAYTWSLPVGTVLFYSEGGWSAAMMAPESAMTPNTIGALSLTSGSLVTLVSEPVSGTGYEFFDVRVGAGVLCWVEIDYNTLAWKLYAQSFAEGQLTGNPQELDHGSKNWEPAMFSPYGSSVIWLKMPSTSGNKTTAASHCYLWSMTDGSKTTVYTSHGRFATHPRVSDGTLTISPRVREDEGTYYGMTALDLADSNFKQLDQLVLPAGVRPFEAVYFNETFVFSIEATYSDSGMLGKMGTFIGREGGPFVYVSREPAAVACGKGARYFVKARSSTCMIDTDNQTYGVISCPDRSLDYGDYPASEGLADNLVTYATIKNAQGIPESVTARVFTI